MDHIVYISVGSNMGNRLENCKFGIAELVRNGKSVLMDLSRFYVTEPVDYQDQDWFVNAVFKIKTDLVPSVLFEKIRRIQQNAGRPEDAIRFGPRILDMDILFYDDGLMNTKELIIPHPRMHKRRFVLKPICDIAPDMVHPMLKKSMKHLLDQLDEHSQKVFPY